MLSLSLPPKERERDVLPSGGRGRVLGEGYTPFSSVENFLNFVGSKFSILSNFSVAQMLLHNNLEVYM